MKSGTILTYDTAEMVAIVAALVPTGCTFTVRRDPNHANGWLITLTGGY